MKKNILLTGLLLLSSAMAFGGGFQLNLQGLRQLAMGGSGTAWTWDASTIFYNPAGLSRLSEWQATGSVLFIMPKVEYVSSGTGNYTTYSDRQVFTPFNLYVGGPVKKDSRVGVGLGVYTPFGSGLKWDDNWAGRFIIQQINLQSIFVQPTASYRINDEVSFGAGFVYAFGNVDLRQALPVQDMVGNDGKAELKGNASGVGFNIGLRFRASDDLQFGVSYRSQVNMKVKGGDATFMVPSSLSSSFPATTFRTSLPLPQVASIGIGYKPMDKLTLQFDINYVGWSSYDSLKFDFAQTTDQLQNLHSPRKYKNTVAFRLGANYNFGSKLSVMIGGAWDPTPVRDGFVSPDLPDANRKVLTGGVAYRPFSKITIMAAVEYTTAAVRDASFAPENFSGRYQTKAITPGIGLSYKF